MTDIQLVIGPADVNPDKNKMVQTISEKKTPWIDRNETHITSGLEAEIQTFKLMGVFPFSGEENLDEAAARGKPWSPPSSTPVTFAPREGVQRPLCGAVAQLMPKKKLGELYERW